MKQDEPKDVTESVGGSSTNEIRRLFAEIPGSVEADSSSPGPDDLHCSFCGRHPDQVKAMISGPGVFICSGCIELCNGIISLEAGEDDAVERLP